MSSNVRGEVRSDEVSPQWDLCCGPCDKYEYLYLYCIVRFPQLNMRFLRKLQQFVRDVEVGILLTL